MIVENLNIVKRHTRPKPMRDSSRMGGTQMTPGGVIEKAAPVPVANVMVVCPTCNRPTRIGMTAKTVKDKVLHVRVCKRADCLAGDRQVMARPEEDKRQRQRLSAAPEGALRAGAAPAACRTSSGLRSVMDVPRLQKITLNMGIGDAKTEAKVLENALDQLTTIAGQRAQVRRARKSIASFKLREGMPVGVARDPPRRADVGVSRPA